MNYELKVTETQNKAGKFLYEVIDQDGNVLASRRSNRVYVAATISGSFFFGRVDLIEKCALRNYYIKNATASGGDLTRYEIAYKK